MKNNRYQALIPFGIFLATFIALHGIYHEASIVKDNFAIFAAIIAIIASFFTFQKGETLNEKVEIFVQGCTQTIIIHMCYIFYASTVFTTILEKTGGIAAAVAISLALIPAWCVIPGLFLVSSLFSFTVGTSMGAIVAFMPIAVSIAQEMSINPSLLAATIVCGAMFGDNLSILSDTTITAVKITNCPMKEKLILNSKIAAPAFLVSLAMLIYQNYTLVVNTQTLEQTGITIIDIIKIIPYALTFILAFLSIDILAVLIIGIVTALGLGIWLQTITSLEAINLFFDGFYASKGMVNVFILVLLLAGLSKIITYNGGIDYLIEKLQNKINSPKQAQCIIFCLIAAINVMIAINTIAILITGPIANKIGQDFKLQPAQTACILDIGSCIVQGLLPYAPQLLLAASIAQVSPLSLFPYLYYQYALTVSLVCAILLTKNSK